MYAKVAIYWGISQIIFFYKITLNCLNSSPHLNEIWYRNRLYSGVALRLFLIPEICTVPAE